MKAFLQTLKPIPLTFLFLFFSLSAQVVLLSSTTTTVLPETETFAVHSFGLGAPIRIISINNQRTVTFQWAILFLNLIGTYLLSAVLANAIAQATRMRKAATVYGLVALSIITATFFVSISVSKYYWGYFFSKPALLSEVKDISAVRSIVAVKTVENSGKRSLIADDTISLVDQLAAAKRYKGDCLDGRMLLALERRGLLPGRFAGSFSILPQLYALIHDCGALESSSPGYDSSAQLRGVLIDAIASEGRRLVFACFTGGQLSNDHYPYYELLLGSPTESGPLSLIRMQRYFYDAAGMEGFEWYVIWPLLALPGVLFAFLFFTAWRAFRNLDGQRA